MPFAVGCAGTLYSGDPIRGKRIARLAALTAGLGLWLYANLAVAVIGPGRPPDDQPTVQSIIGDRLVNNLVLLLFTVTVTATIGWAGSAATGTCLARPTKTPHQQRFALTATAQRAQENRVPATTPRTPGPPGRSGTRRRTVQLLLLCVAVTAAAAMALTSWLAG